MSETNTSGKRQIKASEVKPGMEIEVVTIKKMTVVKNSECDDSNRTLFGDRAQIVRVSPDYLVTVVSEPQPEEPTEFGARVTVSGEKFVRTSTSNADPIPWLRHSDGQWFNWDAVLSRGPVTVVPDYGWSAPTDSEAAPEVPERIEVWPENDEHLWSHRWKDRSGWIWKHHGEVGGGWTARRSDTSATAFTDNSRPCDGPWTIADETRP